MRNFVVDYGCYQSFGIVNAFYVGFYVDFCTWLILKRIVSIAFFRRSKLLFLVNLGGTKSSHVQFLMGLLF